MKTILTAEEQMELLEKRGLVWVDEYSKNIFKIYLKNYGYSHIVYAWKPFTFINKGGGKQKINNSVKSENFIQLFNFDRKISRYALTNIQDIEIKFRNSILNSIKKYLDLINYKNNNKKGVQIFKWSLDELLNIFKNNLSSFEHGDISIFLKGLEEKYFNNKLKSKINRNIYIWDILHKTSFGELICFFQFLNINIQKEVIYYLQDIIPGLRMNINQLIILMKMFKRVRNIICHNDILLIFKHSLPNKKSKNFQELEDFIFKNKLNIKLGKKIKIVDILKLISFFNQWNNTKKSLYNIVLEEFNSEIGSGCFDEKIAKKIKIEINI